MVQYYQIKAGGTSNIQYMKFGGKRNHDKSVSVTVKFHSERKVTLNKRKKGILYIND
jgi:hypothetical protein